MQEIKFRSETLGSKCVYGDLISIDDAVYLAVKDAIKQEIKSRHFWCGTIKRDNWKLIASLILYDDGDIAPIWYEFAINGETNTDFSFHEVRKLL